MSIQLIQKYFADVDKIKYYSGAGKKCKVIMETMKIVKEMPE